MLIEELICEEIKDEIHISWLIRCCVHDSEENLSYPNEMFLDLWQLRGMLLVHAIKEAQT